MFVPRITWITFLIFFLSLVLNAQTKTELTVAKIMQGADFVGNLPVKPYWSEDSKHIYFMWNPENADEDSLYKISIFEENSKPQKVSQDELLTAPAASGKYTRDYSKKVFIREGDIFLEDIKNNTLQRITSTYDTERNAAFNQDETSIIFQRGRGLFSWDIKSGEMRQIVQFKSGKNPNESEDSQSEIEDYIRKEELELISILKEQKEKRERKRKSTDQKREIAVIYIESQNIYNLQLAPDGKFVTLLLGQKHSDLDTKVPSYVDESGYSKMLTARSKVGSPQQKYKFAVVDLQKESLIYTDVKQLPGIFEDINYTSVKEKDKEKTRDVIIYGPQWSTDGKNGYVEIRSSDNKDRWFALLDLTTAKLTSIEHQHDEAWIGGPNISWWNGAGESGWLPDNKSIWFCSEESGYSHLYTYDVVKKSKRALTKGEFEIYWPLISRDKKHWYFSANKIHPAEKNPYRMPIDGSTTWEKITDMPGSNRSYPSPDGKHVIIYNSYSNKPWELYLKKTKADAAAKQLTFSTTAEWQRYPWRDPQIVRFKAADGEMPYARLYRPEKPNGAAVIFVHGAGYLHNAHKWWSTYYREYMFHNLLTDRGYTVLDIDYRGSAGYGRDWRTAIYRHMGGKDLSDHIDGAKYLVNEHGIDSQRIGIYGGSYGGFITLMAMFTKPDVFKSGAALRSVTDWAHYNHPYTSNILNIPQADSVAYRRSSPIYFAEGLKGNLLICHGMIDTNVHFQDVVRLSQRLIELGKENWELAVYPLEGHSFKEASSWTDEYSRILRLFEDTLR